MSVVIVIPYREVKKTHCPVQRRLLHNFEEQKIKTKHLFDFFTKTLDF